MATVLVKISGPPLAVEALTQFLSESKAVMDRIELEVISTSHDYVSHQGISRRLELNVCELKIEDLPMKQ